MAAGEGGAAVAAGAGARGGGRGGRRPSASSLIRLSLTVLRPALLVLLRDASCHHPCTAVKLLLVLHARVLDPSMAVPAGLQVGGGGAAWQGASREMGGRASRGCSLSGFVMRQADMGWHTPSSSVLATYHKSCNAGIIRLCALLLDRVCIECICFRACITPCVHLSLCLQASLFTDAVLQQMTTISARSSSFTSPSPSSLPSPSLPLVSHMASLLAQQLLLRLSTHPAHGLCPATPAGPSRRRTAGTHSHARRGALAGMGKGRGEEEGLSAWEEEETKEDGMAGEEGEDEVEEEEGEEGEEGDEEDGELRVGMWPGSEGGEITTTPQFYQGISESDAPSSHRDLPLPPLFGSIAMSSSLQRLLRLCLHLQVHDVSSHREMLLAAARRCPLLAASFLLATHPPHLHSGEQGRGRAQAGGAQHLPSTKW